MITTTTTTTTRTTTTTTTYNNNSDNIAFRAQVVCLYRIYNITQSQATPRICRRRVPRNNIIVIWFCVIVKIIVVNCEFVICEFVLLCYCFQ